VNLTGFAADITRRSRWARDHNDGHPEPAWSTGERLAIGGQRRADRIAGDLEFYGYGAGVETWIADIREGL
jgi:hypothetical protein